MTSNKAFTVDTRQSAVQSPSFIEALDQGIKNGTTDFVRLIATPAVPSSDRNRIRREAFFSEPFSICIERARAYTESFKETQGQPRIIRMAKAFARYMETVTPVLHEGDLFAGYAGGKILSSQIYPELLSTYMKDDVWETARGFEVNPIHIRDEEIEELKEMADYWVGQSILEQVLNSQPEDIGLLLQSGLISPINMMAGIGHMIVDVDRVLKSGLRSFLEEAETKAKSLEAYPEDGQTPKKIAFYKAVAIAVEGVITYANHCAEYAQAMAFQEPDAVRRMELERIATALTHVPEHPARDFFEAIQCTLILLSAHQMESCEISVCPGRIDQFLLPYYERGIETGSLARETAVELLENFLIHVAQSSWMYYGNMRGPISHPRRGNLVTVTLSGLSEDGRDMTNELTWLVLHAQANTALGFPNMAVRMHDNSPTELWEAVARVIGTGNGQPSIMNDEVMVPALKRIGLESKDAYNYANIGCVEMGSAGTSIGPVSIGFVNIAKCLDLALHNGRCSILGEQVGPETGDARGFTEYSQLLQAYATQVRFALTKFNQSVSAIEMAHERLRPIPFQSSITDNAMELGLDLTGGGSKYYTSGIEGVGLADVADSLAAIKTLGFDEKRISMPDLVEALQTDFDGQEDLRRMLIKDAPKFGNDIPLADEIARESCTIFMKEVKNHIDYWGSVNYPGIWSIEMAMSFGWQVGALPSGRRATEALTEGVAPSRGMDRSGPTAVIKSVAKLDHHLMENGSIFNMKFSPAMFSGQNIDRFTATMKTYFDLGGFQIQVAVVDRATLIDAQKNPQDHRDLVVRVAGYCGHFTELNPRTQQHIIDRTEH